MKSILLFLLFSLTKALLLNNNKLIPIISKLESIITAKAFTTSFYANLRTEFTIDKLFIEMNHFNNHNLNSYISMIIIYLYGEYKYIKGSKRTEKLQKIDKYDNMYRNFKEIIYIFIFIFTKDVQHAI